MYSYGPTYYISNSVISIYTQIEHHISSFVSRAFVMLSDSALSYNFVCDVYRRRIVINTRRDVITADRIQGYY